MRLTKVRIRNYRSIDDSGWVDCSQNVLCLVGKNESGKTSFLVALERLNPIDQARAQFNIEKDYPRKGLNAYRRRHATEPDNVIDAVFQLTEEDCTQLNATLGPNVLKPQEVHFTKGYDNQLRIRVVHDEAAAMRHATTNADLLAQLAEFKDYKSLEAAAQGKPELAALLAHINSVFPKGVGTKVRGLVRETAPQFLYFDDYSTMKGRVSLPAAQGLFDALKGNPAHAVTRADRTFLALLSMANTTPAELIASRNNAEALFANLEAAGIEITQEVFKFWTQNDSLMVKFDIKEQDDEDRGVNRQAPVFHTRIWNNRHQMTVSFDERSKGFVWFFSFLAYFSTVKNNPKPVVLLLDEPGLSLHAMAQNDFLRFIDDKLAKAHQVLYTTHSPFMVDPNHPARIRLVEDKEDVGTTISSDFIRSRHGQDTLYPLMAAMGISITQTLFVGPNSLLVEGPSELLYLPAISKILRDEGRVALDPRWTLTPINGVDKAPSFVALFGANKLNLAVLMDYEPAKKRLRDSLRENATLGIERVLSVTDFTNTPEADVEDMFTVEEYLRFVNHAYKRYLPKPLQDSQLGSGNRIVKRLEHYFEANVPEAGKFGHAFIAEQFARDESLSNSVAPTTLDRFEALFKRLNGILTPVAVTENKPVKTKATRTA